MVFGNDHVIPVVAPVALRVIADRLVPLKYDTDCSNWLVPVWLKGARYALAHRAHLGGTGTSAAG